MKRVFLSLIFAGIALSQQSVVNEPNITVNVWQNVMAPANAPMTFGLICVAEPRERLEFDNYKAPAQTPTLVHSLFINVVQNNGVGDLFVPFSALLTNGYMTPSGKTCFTTVWAGTVESISSVTFAVNPVTLKATPAAQ